MNLSEYGDFVRKLWAQHNSWDQELAHASAGLTEEVGEVMKHVKRHFRGDRPLEGKYREEMAYELGDALYYLVAEAHAIGYTFEDIASMNVAKLEDRAKRGKLKGEGDKR